MQFVYPTFLWGLLLVLIPLIIHLFYFRRYKTVYFSNVRFLKQLKEQTSAKRNIKHLLVLICRMAAVASLVIAFAVPFIPNDQQKENLGAKDVSIFIDNSFSMSAERDGLILIDQAKQNALDILSTYSDQDRFHIFTMDFEGKDQRWVSKEDAETRINQLRLTNRFKNLQNVFDRQHIMFDKGANDNNKSFVISDFQESFIYPSPPIDSMIDHVFIPVNGNKDQNVSVDSVYFDSPIQQLGQTNILYVLIRNHSDESINNIRTTLRIGSNKRPLGIIDLSANEKYIDTIQVSHMTAGWQDASVTITDFPVEFDNTYYFTFNVRDQIRIAQIESNQPVTSISTTFNDVERIRIQTAKADKLDYGQLSENDLIVLNDLPKISSGMSMELKGMVEDGLNLLIFPSHNADLTSYNSFLNTLGAEPIAERLEQSRKVTVINTEEFVFNDVFKRLDDNIRLPSVAVSYNLEKRSRSGREMILRFANGDPFVAKYPLGAGFVYVCLSPLNSEYSNFMTENAEVFVPMIYKMALSARQTQPLAYTIGDNTLVQVDLTNDLTDHQLRLKNEQTELIPPQFNRRNATYIQIGDQLTKQSYYQLMHADTILRPLAFNFSRQESIMNFGDSDYFATVQQSGVLVLQDRSDLSSKTEWMAQAGANEIWSYFLWAALLFLALETLIIRMVKT